MLIFFVCKQTTAYDMRISDWSSDVFSSYRDPIFRDAIASDIPAMLTLSHVGDARGADTPPLDPAIFTDPRTLAGFAAIKADPAHRLIVAERDGEIGSAS